MMRTRNYALSTASEFQPLRYRMQGVVLVVPGVEGLQVIRVVGDEDREVSTVLHQELLVLRLEVTAPLEFGGQMSTTGQRQLNAAQNTLVIGRCKFVHRSTQVIQTHRR